MAQVVGDENIFIFGLKTPEVESLKNKGYHSWEFIERSAVLKEIFQLIRGDFFSQNAPGLFMPIVQSLTQDDPFLVCADFESYCQTQDKISRLYMNKDQWVEKSIINVSRSGFFSSDRTIGEYAKDIWKVPVKR
jgi:starch phosphorylase